MLLLSHLLIKEESAPFFDTEGIQQYVYYLFIRYIFLDTHAHVCKNVMLKLSFMQLRSVATKIL